MSFIGSIFMFGEIRSDMYMYFSLGKFWRLSFGKLFYHLKFLSSYIGRVMCLMLFYVCELQLLVMHGYII